MVKRSSHNGASHHEACDNEEPSAKRRLATQAPRASQACQACAVSKVRCDDLRVCRRCQKKRITCVRPPQVSHDSLHGPVQSRDVNSSTGPCLPTGDNQALARQRLTPRTLSSEPLNRTTSEANGSLPFQSENADTASTAVSASPLMAWSSTPRVNREPSHLDPATESFSMLDDAYHLDGILDFSMTASKDWPGVAAFDSPFGEVLITQAASFDFAVDSDTSVSHAAALLAAPTPESIVWTGSSVSQEAVQAYDATLGCWRPRSKDYAALDRAFLSIPLEEQCRMRGSMGYFDPTVTSESLSCFQRDGIVLAAADYFSTTQPPQPIASFPSIEILDELLRIFLTYQKDQPTGFLHVSTFSPSSCPMSLLMACIAAGAVFSPNPAAHKFGLAMAEQENLLTRTVPYIQSCVILSDIALWCGDKRKSEISDIMSGFPLTCTQRAIVRDTVPQISCLEISTPLPEQAQLWSACSAAEWGLIHLELRAPHGKSRLSLTDCLVDPTAIQALPPLQDGDFTRTMMAYSLLSMLVEDRRRSIVFTNHFEDSWPCQNLYGPSMARHMTVLFDETRGLVDSPRPGLAAAEFICEFHGFYSASPTYLIEALLGNERHANAREAFCRLDEWRQTRRARTAVWHAGQLFRTIRMIMPKERTDFHVFVLFHAVLCLWAFAIVGKKSPPAAAKAHNQADPNGGPKIRLDGLESLQTQRWISRDQGCPYIADASKMVGVTDRATSLISLVGDSVLESPFMMPLLELQGKMIYRRCQD
ncbi:hypothetical protein B0J13DRAFT_590229 [Dactylonectria estremocensis]|uniref:Zn(2)-C6 fungal-type domain-containing protein n=1 Tax=Dactylonectria estremocensis TaxID=1079267 RepID=A0A9P9IEU0_9HYPO|nr:hypothetical protein B0J13DRAFT_590229 [Dactylonectria estremocensis]